MDIYSFINSRDVAEYCESIGKTWNPFEMAVIIGRSCHRVLTDKHEAWRELIANYPDMPTPETRYYQSYDSLHKKLAEVIAYEERALELFKKPETSVFYEYEIHGDAVSVYPNRDRIFPDFESAWTKLKLDLKYVRANKITEIEIKKFYIGSRHRIDCSLDFEGNIRSLFVACKDERFPDINFDDLLDLSPGFNCEEEFYVDIPVPFKHGDILRERYSYVDRILVLEKLCDREKIFARHRCMNEEAGDDSDIGWGYQINDRGVLYGDVVYENDCFEYYHEKLEKEQRLLRYVSLYLKGEINWLALLTLQSRIMLENKLNNDLRLCDYGLDLPQSILAEEYSWEEDEAIEEIKIYSGIFWVITEDIDLTEHQLLMFGIPCDEHGNIISTPKLQPNSESGKTYNHKLTWETEVVGKRTHETYSRNPYYYYPRGRVEIANKRAVIFLNPHINQPDIVNEIKLKFGLGSKKISRIRIVEDGSYHYRCFLDTENE